MVELYPRPGDDINNRENRARFGDSPLGRAPLHQHRRDEGQGREKDPENEKRHHPLGPLLPAQSGQAEDAHRDAGGRQDGVDVFGQLEGEDGSLPGDAALAGV